jgi:predicted DNA-binding antitoxin AbrB/MazE fold protein
MEIIRILGDKIAEKVNISPPAARGLLRLAIKDQLGPFKPLNQIDLKDFKLVIENSLKQRLKNLEISNNDKVIESIIEELKKLQSLITMENI